MSKIIAVSGSPGSGKTTFALKLAEELYDMLGTRVLFLTSDLRVPGLAYIFPHSKGSELYSVGKVLDKTDIFKEDVVKEIVSVKTMRNFGFLGYKGGDTMYTYPEPTEDKVMGLFGAMRELAEYIVVDCSGIDNDLISVMAMAEADVRIRLIVPDLKSMAYYASHPIAEDAGEIKAFNIMDDDLYLPIDEMDDHFSGVEYIIPYSRPLKQQAITGTLSEHLVDVRYRSAMADIAKRVISLE